MIISTPHTSPISLSTSLLFFLSFANAPSPVNIVYMYNGVRASTEA